MRVSRRWCYCNILGGLDSFGLVEQRDSRSKRWRCWSLTRLLVLLRLLHLGVVFLLLLLNVLDQCKQLAEVLLTVLLEDGHTELETFTAGQQLYEVIFQ